eukprot:Clim_evm61s236 gene=Clim_evmTU61s236
MDYLSRGFAALSAQAPEQSSNDAVERLVERINSSTLLEDRRDAVRALRSLSRDYAVEVGAQGMSALIDVLQNDRADNEIIRFALETLANVMDTSNLEKQEQGRGSGVEGAQNLGVQFTEIFTKDPGNVTILLELLEEPDTSVQYHTARLITICLVNQPQVLQETILTSPMGVTRLMDMISDPREVIRNEGLLLLIELTKDNQHIQKIVAFENAFESLLNIVAEEGYSDGDIIVGDCLVLLLNLLRTNSSNQTLFRETGCFAKLVPFLTIEDGPRPGAGGHGGDDGSGAGAPNPAAMMVSEWDQKKAHNFILMLDLIRSMANPALSSGTNAGANKTAINQSGLTAVLTQLAFRQNLPFEVKYSILITLGEVLRGHKTSQDLFAQMESDRNATKKVLPAPMCMLLTAFEESRRFAERMACLHVFECYVDRNSDAQANLTANLVDSQGNNLSFGPVVCGGLFGRSDAMNNWIAAVALSQVLRGNLASKEKALKAAISVSMGTEPMTLLEQCSRALFSLRGKGKGDHNAASALRSRVGLLLLMVTWLAECPAAVKQFLSFRDSVSYMVEEWEHSSGGPNVAPLVRSLAAVLLGICYLFNDDSSMDGSGGMNSDAIYQIINTRLGEDAFARQLKNLPQMDVIVRAIKSTSAGVGLNVTPDSCWIDGTTAEMLKRIADQIVAGLPNAGGNEGASAKPSGGGSRLEAGVDYHDSVVSQYKDIIRRQDEELRELRARAGTASSGGEQNGGGGPDPAALQQLQGQVQQLQSMLQDRDQAMAGLQRQLELAQSQSPSAATPAGGEELATAQRRLQESEQTLATLRDEHGELSQEHEDLLVCLAEQDMKLQKYRRQLRALGQEVSEDEDADDDDEML